MKGYNEITGITSVQALGITAPSGSHTAIVYTCPYCNAKVNLAVADNVKIVICPVCGKEFAGDKDIAEELIDSHIAIEKRRSNAKHS